MSKSGAIFISYRRSDSIAEAGRVYDRLASAFGSERVFKDVDNIPYGADFVEYLDQAVAQCEVLIPLIGTSWLMTTDARGQRRLDDPNDFVRIEIASALKRDILVLPILLGGATMPGPSELPEDLKPLARRNAAQVRYDPDFHNDMSRIVSKLQEYFVGSVSKIDQRGSTISKASEQQIGTSSQRRTGALLPAALSGVNGLLILATMGDIPFKLISGILLIAAAAALMTRKVWAWGAAIAAQTIAIICFVQEILDGSFVYDEEYGEFFDFGLFFAEDTPYALLVIGGLILALATVIVLLTPKIRRNFK